jgi:hypothetical protein
MSSKKEPNFFTHNYSQGWDWYANFFIDVGKAKAIGEATTWYMRDQEAPARIANDLPNTKLIFILRNPVERAYSHYWYQLSWGYHEWIGTFADRIHNPEEPAKLVESGKYADQLRRYLDFFPREQMLILLYEDIKQDLYGTIKEVYRFLKISEDFQANITKKHNVTFYPRVHQAYRFYKKMAQLGSYIEKQLEDPALASIKQKTKLPRKAIKRILYSKGNMPPMKSEDREYLLQLYKNQILWLEDFLNRDLSIWKQ